MCAGWEECLTPCAFFALSAYERTGGWAVAGVGETIDLFVERSGMTSCRARTARERDGLRVWEPIELS